ncbi:MAG TPA: C-terminal binding protein [Dehalococcoidia bacterium]|jgi:D-3-phosphoglycerate dehydrogenase|nr:C-terminal binding protein [Dehalococcoidia bacterium]
MSYKVVMVVKHPLIPHDEEDYRRIGAEFLTRPCQTEDELIAAAHDADFVLTFRRPFTRKVIQKLERCRMIFNIGTGYESIDVAAATEYGICVSYPDGYCSEEVAEHAMAFILACARKLVRLDRAVREGKWDSYEKREIRSKILPPVFPLKNQTLGLIGFGRISRALVPKAKGFEMRVIAHDPYVSAHVFEEFGVTSVDLEQLLSDSDFVSIHAAFTPQARHLLGMEEFKRMKPTAYLINCARGEFIDEQALYTALSQGYIAGAALDVIQAESMGPEHPLLQLENLIITPHTAYYSEESIAKLTRRPYEEVARMMRGEWPRWLVNPEVKENFQSRWGQKSSLGGGPR